MKFRTIVIAMMLLCNFPSSYAKGDTESFPVFGVHYFNGIPGVLIRQAKMINPDSCQRTDWYILEKAHPLYKEILALIMTSHITGQPLIFAVEGCNQNMPTIQHVVSWK